MNKAFWSKSVFWLMLLLITSVTVCFSWTWASVLITWTVLCSSVFSSQTRYRIWVALQLAYKAFLLAFLWSPFGVATYLVGVATFIVPYLCALVFLLREKVWIKAATLSALALYLSERALSLYGIGLDLFLPAPFVRLPLSPFIEPSALFLAMLVANAKESSVWAKYAAFFLFLSALDLSSKHLRYSRVSSGENLRVAVIQTDFESKDYEDSDAVRREILSLVYEALSKGAKLIVLPEGIAPDPGVYDDKTFSAKLSAASTDYDAGILIGSKAWTEDASMNGSFFYYEGGPWGPYVKKRLIFGAEWVPVWLRAFVPQGYGQLQSKPWQEPFVFRGSVLVIPKLCFEVLAPIPVNENSQAAIVAVQGSTSFDHLGWASSALMAKIDTQAKATDVVLAAVNSGPSAIFYKGVAIANLPRGRTGVLVENVRLNLGQDTLR